MAEGFLRKYADREFDVFSAGLEQKGINPYTIQVMKEVGVDMGKHTSKSLTQYLGKVHFGYLITVCSDADKNCPVFPGKGKRLHWGFEDPAAFNGSHEEKLAKFRQVRDQIAGRIQSWLTEMGILFGS